MIERAPVAAVTVMDEEARRFTVPAAAFDDLLRHPFGCGVSSNLDMQDLAVGVTDHEKDIESLERTQTKSQAHRCRSCLEGARPPPG